MSVGICPHCYHADHADTANGECHHCPCNLHRRNQAIKCPACGHPKHYGKCGGCFCVSPLENEVQRFRVGTKNKLNVYDGDRPICQCHDERDAQMVVDGLNALAPARRVCGARNQMGVTVTITCILDKGHAGSHMGPYLPEFGPTYVWT